MAKGLGHCWVCFDHGGRVKVGFDDFMVKLFGAFQSMALPPIGATMEKDQVGVTFGRDDHNGAALSPLTGTVLAVNQKVREYPGIPHKDPYHEGWLYILEPDMPKKNLKGLYYGKESMAWIDKESQKLLNLMGPEYEHLAATGAQPMDDIFRHFPQIGWDRLVKDFLHTSKKS